MTGMVITTHRSLVEKGERKEFVGDKGLGHTQKRGKKGKKYIRKKRYPRSSSI